MDQALDLGWRPELDAIDALDSLELLIALRAACLTADEMCDSLVGGVGAPEVDGFLRGEGEALLLSDPGDSEHGLEGRSEEVGAAALLGEVDGEDEEVAAAALGDGDFFVDSGLTSFWIGGVLTEEVDPAGEL